MIQKPGIIQLSYTGNELYAQGAFPQVGINTADTSEVADQAQTALLASRDPVINEVSVGISGADSVQDRVFGATPLALPGAINVPLDYCLVSIEAEQDLHGYQYPWPAGGNVNIWNPANITHYFINGDGSLISSPTWDMITILNPEIGDKYTLSAVLDSGSYPLRLAAYDSNDDLIIQNAVTGTGIKSVTMIIPANTVTLRGCISNVYGTNIQLQIGDYSSYVPYSNICPITGHSTASVYIEPSYDPAASPKATTALGQTVYGGELDMVSGYGSVNTMSVDMGSLSWTLASENTSRQVWRTALPKYYTHNAYQPMNALCETARIVSYQASWTPYCVAAASSTTQYNHIVYVTKPGEFADGTAVAIALTGVKFVYEYSIADSLSVSSQPSIIPPAGDCEAWTDCGSTIDIVYTKQP